MAEPPYRKVEMVDRDQLVPAKRNARIHSKKQVRQIADSIERFGFNVPVVIDADNVIIAGHGRVAAAKLLGIRDIPCVRVESMSLEDRRAYAIADNKIALNSCFDKEVLALEFQELLDAGFEVEVTGFDLADVDQILFDHAESSTKPSGPEDLIPEAPSTAEAVTQTGDVWIMGNHKLICGDAKDPDVLDYLIAGEEPDMIFTDAPYNVPIQGHVSGRGQAKHREFAEASGEMSREAWRHSAFPTSIVAAVAVLMRQELRDHMFKLAKG